MAFSLNGNTLQWPTTHKWVKPPSFGTSGEGRPLYPGIMQYELDWSTMSQSDYNILLHTYMSGTAVTSSLPRWGTDTTGVAYQFTSYTGTFVDMPEFQTYFEGTYNGVKLLINNVAI